MNLEQYFNKIPNGLKKDWIEDVAGYLKCSIYNIRLWVYSGKPVPRIHHKSLNEFSRHDTFVKGILTVKDLEKEWQIVSNKKN